MPSSISNSKQNHRWVTTWLVTAVLVLVTVGSYELYLWKNGYTASIEVNKDLWSGNRKAVKDNSNVVALVGASRIQLGLNTSTLRSHLPDKTIVPLAINGQYPMATLKSLAEDETFNGLVVMSFMAQMLEPQYVEMQSAYNDYYAHQASLYLSFDAYLTALVKSKFRFLHPLLSLHEVINNFSKKKIFPTPFYVSVHVDSSAFGDYSEVDTERLKKYLIAGKTSNYQEYQIMDKATWLEQLKSLSQYVNAIQAKGGDVVLVRFPTDDEHWLLDEVYYPRTQFWDVMVETMPQLKTIHFKDDDVLSSFELPDSSHLDQTDTAAFTLRLIELLQQLQLLD